jgi:hypothetical protein
LYIDPGFLMTRRSKLWLAVASLSNFINAAGGGYAVALGEEAHTAVHAVLLLLGTFWAWRLATRADQQESLGLPAAARMEQLQQSVDAIAIEVERIGEAQRFTAKLKQERTETDR